MNLPKAERRTETKALRRTMWIYGAPYTGKSTFADSAPMPLFLNTDGNAGYLTAPFISIKDEVKVEGRLTKRKFAWDVFKETIEELEKGGNGFKTIVLDLVEDTREMCRLYMFNKLGITHESDDSYRAWDKIDLEFMSTMRRFCNLPYDNIVIISHEDTTKDLTRKSGDRITSIKPNLREKNANKLAGMVGFTGRCIVDEGVHKLEIKCDEVVFGGGRLGLTNVTVPLDWDEVAKLFENTKEA